MQDVLLEVYKTLKASSSIKQQFNAIYNNPRAPDKAQNIFPRLTMFEILRSDAEAADNAAFFAEVRIRVDIWSKKNNLFELSAAVKEAIEGSFEMCRVDMQSDIYEDDTHIYHKPINIRIKTEV